MTYFTINTRIDGPMTFSVSHPRGTVKMSYSDNPAAPGSPICLRGDLMGATVEATPETLEAVARDWLADHRRLQRKREAR